MTSVLVLRVCTAIIAGYLLGSIPSGVLVGKLFGNRDPRDYGSRKTGATNVLRTIGPGAAALVTLLDVGKGAAAVLLARVLLSFPEGTHVFAAYGTSWQAIAGALAALAALLGHNYSVFIGFKGGRGVLTGAGAVLVMDWVAWLVGFIAAATPIALTRYVSLGSILGATACPIAGFVLMLTGHDNLPQVIFMALGGAFIIVSHADNIKRLLNGTERKLGQPAEGGNPAPSAAPER
ncbi:MAG TPA: glycerol-3-phosphate 1-O-acyltransferase PlsY [Ktedonobacterales bacterium]|jgi:glycerol-3-phosphate acyltransferase PlsY|nr:glycerol-3-phosphate 1-O-acyltransferase PlsY [Ktedonobacterales bacterium]